MSVWDGRILEILANEGPMRVGKITDHEAIRVSNSQISDRCGKLAENGLIEPLGNGVYRITDEGEAYLRGEYDAEEGVYIEQPEAEAVEGEPAEGESEGESNGES